MLVLTRKSGEAIRVGDAVTITVVQLGRGRVRLGVVAPAHVAILRSELAERRSPTDSPAGNIAHERDSLAHISPARDEIAAVGAEVG